MGDIDGQGNPSKTSQATIAPVGQSMAQLWLLWHFHIALRSGYVLPHQIKVIRDTVHRIGHGKGIKQALLGGRAVP